MADILKITTPLVNKNQIQPNKQATDPSVPFNLQDVTKVIKPASNGELLKQNNGMIQKEEASTILSNLLKDPSVTVNFLKNIFILQEIIKLLPVNNSTVTQEIEQLFNSLLIKPEDIVVEMMRQENTSTVFKGELFNFLRGLIAGNPTPEIRAGVANLLKSINGLLGKQDVLNAISNSLQFLSENLEASKLLSGRLQTLSDQFRAQDAAQKFGELKTQVLEIFKEVEGSILYSPRMAKVIAISLYNLSRFNNNPDFFQESVSNLMLLLDGKQQRGELAAGIDHFLAQMTNAGEQNENSKIMDILAQIIGKQADNADFTLLNSEKIEKIIHSLLSSPCNFTPLLHFVIPVQYDQMKSFAEIWINPNGSEDERNSSERSGKRNIHMLIVFDIEGIGQFEAELNVLDQTIDFSLFCPPAYVSEFSGMKDRFVKCISASSYQFGTIAIDKLERPRSLMDVFKSLPYKRTGVNVKI
ncbi:antitoxin [Marasmitruncus massiliensis]|uniref:antitoxin n=1 Tax=Marasmitruncus massiliensis TaxID=1944642 RepID=UPI000C7BE184|nr:antitoxin [Marasmitruncus massiliensis]